MSMQPGNPVVGGGVLRYPQVQSPNFIHGVQGWCIRSDGTAEFQNVIIPGGGAVSIGSLTSGTLGAVGTLGAGGAFQTAASGTRLVIDANGLNLYNGVTNTVSLDATTGNGTFAGTLNGASGTFVGSLSGNSISGALITGTTINSSAIVGSTVETATSGARVVLDTSLYAGGALNIYDGFGNVGSLYAGGAGALQTSNGFTVNGTLQAFSLGTSGSLSVSGNATCYSTTTTAYLTVNNNATVSGTLTAGQVNTSTVHGSTLNLGTGSDTVIVGTSSGQTALGSTVVNWSNITQIARGTNPVLYLSGRRTFFDTSSRASKVDIRDLDDVIVADVLAIQPVSFFPRLPEGEDPTLWRRQVGVIADDVAEIDPTLDTYLVNRDEHGEVNAFAYDKLSIVQQIVLRDHAKQLAAQAAQIADLRTRV